MYVELVCTDCTLYICKVLMCIERFCFLLNASYNRPGRRLVCYICTLLFFLLLLLLICLYTLGRERKGAGRKAKLWNT